MKEILMTATESNIRSMIGWGMAVIIGFLILRATKDFMDAISEADTGIKEAFNKSKKRVYAVLIAITVESTIAFIARFYR